MCGIAGFISNHVWLEKPDLSWLEGISRDLETWSSSTQPVENLARPLKELVGRFDDLMSFGLHVELAENAAI